MKREVAKGAAGRDRTEITKGLRADESVITSLEAKGLSDGKRVRVAEKKSEDKKDAAKESPAPAKVQVDAK